MRSPVKLSRKIATAVLSISSGLLCLESGECSTEGAAECKTMSFIRNASYVFTKRLKQSSKRSL